MRVAIVDCETTGLGQQDEPISIAVLVLEVDEKGNGTPLLEWYGEQYPNVEISQGAFAVHGRTRDSLQGKEFDLESLRKAIEGVDVLVAHNARFDAKMIGKVVPEVLGMSWRCSYRQSPWRLADLKLDEICKELGVAKPAVHDAAGDVKALYGALSLRYGKTERSGTYLKTLMRKGDIPVFPADAPPISINKKINVVTASGDPANMPLSITVNKVFQDAMMDSPVGTAIKLWSAGPEMDTIIAYARRSIGSEMAFVLDKNENEKLTDLFESGKYSSVEIGSIESSEFTLKIVV